MFCRICNQWHPKAASAVCCQEGRYGEQANGDNWTLEEELAAWDEASNEALYNFEKRIEDIALHDVHIPEEEVERDVAAAVKAYREEKRRGLSTT